MCFCSLFICCCCSSALSPNAAVWLAVIALGKPQETHTNSRTHSEKGDRATFSQQKSRANAHTCIFEHESVHKHTHTGTWEMGLWGFPGMLGKLGLTCKQKALNDLIQHIEVQHTQQSHTDLQESTDRLFVRIRGGSAYSSNEADSYWFLCLSSIKDKTENAGLSIHVKSHRTTCEISWDRRGSCNQLKLFELFGKSCPDFRPCFVEKLGDK